MMVLLRLFLLLSACLTGACDGIKAVPEGPIFMQANIGIKAEDIPGIMAISRDFANQRDLSFEAGSGPHGFTILMDRGRLSIAAYNTVHRDLAYIRAWPRDSRNSDRSVTEQDRSLARDYVSLIRAIADGRAIR
jgi:hypothetical protein